MLQLLHLPGVVLQKIDRLGNVGFRFVPILTGFDHQPGVEFILTFTDATGGLDRQLNPSAIPDKVTDGVLARLPLASLGITEIRNQVAAGKLKQYSWDPMWQLGFAAVARAIWSERQLLEVMADFWSNHLNVTCPYGDVWDNRTDYDRNVIRKFALGRFADLLKASARHPAMLTYLDNRYSTKDAPNENYGRELLELHTVGLAYTEADVRNAARLLTGLTVDHKTGLYRYDGASHAVGAVRVLAFQHANATASGGEAAALALLDYLALHPATARRIIVDEMGRPSLPFTGGTTSTPKPRDAPRSSSTVASPERPRPKPWS